MPLCKHQRYPNYCRDCRPYLFCHHDRLKKQCKYCDLASYLIYLQAVRICTSLRKVENKVKYKTKDLIGCTKEEFKQHIESLFKPGMTWENIEIDHIKPISWFDLEDENEVRKCFHWKNTQPLFKADNRKKFDKWTKAEEKAWRAMIHV